MERKQLMGEFKTEDKITPEYLNKKMESMMAALYDTIEETEKRLRNMEKLIHENANKTEK